MRIVHVQTVVQTTFGVVDDDGNVIPQEPIVARVNRFSVESFTQVHSLIAEQRDKSSQPIEDTSTN